MNETTVTREAKKAGDKLSRELSTRLAVALTALRHSHEKARELEDAFEETGYLPGSARAAEHKRLGEEIADYAETVKRYVA